MDSGAHFYKCDFQVHTPRDTNWSGGDAVSESERKAYAAELILACRKKGVGAIAITDHHDFAFFPYIKRAALEELDDIGAPIPKDRRLVVFPGMEMTLASPPCQALLILDADFPENLLQSILTAIGISPAESANSKTLPTVQPISQNLVSNFLHLYQTLNSHDHLKGRFIVFPLVSDGGHKTLLRPGFADYYKSMPCVGAYVDGSVSKLGRGNVSILAGKDRNYGFKPVAVFQTSDNRKRDHSDLGRYTTWVKWSEPTAEALRQACLAKESRISQVEQQLPDLWIESMRVSNSRFLGRLDVVFNQQYNSVIGGRGTGKSTILEYLRWALCDQPADADSEIAPVQTKRMTLIQDTLHSFNGEIVVTFLLNGVNHIVKRTSNTQETWLKIGNTEFVPASESEVRSLLPIQAYSQKQLSSVGVRVDELRRFVELPIKQSLDQIRAEIHDVKAKIRSSYGDVIRGKELGAEWAQYDVEATSLKKQLEQMRKTLKGLSKRDQDTIKQKAAYENEEVILDYLDNGLTKARERVQQLAADMIDKIDDDDEAEVQNVALIRAVRQAYSTKLEQINAQVATLSALFTGHSLKAISAARAKWFKAQKQFDKKYEAATKRAKVNEHQLKQIRSTEKRVAELKKLQITNRNTVAGLGEPEGIYALNRERWRELHTAKAKALAEQCEKFTILSGGIIKVDVEESLDTKSLKQQFKVAFAGLNIKDQKIEDLCLRILQAPDMLNAWTELLSELEQLALHKNNDPASLPSTAVMDKCGFIGSEKERLVAGFNTSKWLELSLTELEFNPVFKYCVSRKTNEYIDFVNASAGQQATALLTVLLNQPGAPLVIDQPEDDVDSKMSPEVVQQIWLAKNRRQLIFASHNANFVVNGDSELVVCCDYVNAGDQTGGQIKVLGAIDNSKVREEITLVTEGGEAAFKLRMEKYGF